MHYLLQLFLYKVNRKHNRAVDYEEDNGSNKHHYYPGFGGNVAVGYVREQRVNANHCGYIVNQNMQGIFCRVRKLFGAHYKRRKAVNHRKQRYCKVAEQQSVGKAAYAQIFVGVYCHRNKRQPKEAYGRIRRQGAEAAQKAKAFFIVHYLIKPLTFSLRVAASQEAVTMQSIL